MYHRVFPRFGRQMRIALCRMGQREASSETRRFVPIWSESPWQPRVVWAESFRRARPVWRDMKANVDDLFRRMETMESPRSREGPGYYRRRPGWTAETASKPEVAQVKCDKNVFEVRLDVQRYTPDEMTVKVAGNRLTVHGKHELAEDQHGYVAHEFHREFLIPENVDLDSVSSAISEEGVLIVRANIRAPEETIIEIQKQTKEPVKADE